MSAVLDEKNEFLTHFRGSFYGILRWQELTELWATLRQPGNPDWYIYAVGERPPASPASETELTHFLAEIDALLRKEHQEDYCGVVYVDDKIHPSFIKIYDPNNLGVVCGFSKSPPLPGWILSTLPPCEISTLPLSGSRQRWWQRIFKSKNNE